MKQILKDLIKEIKKRLKVLKVCSFNEVKIRRTKDKSIYIDFVEVTS